MLVAGPGQRLDPLWSARRRTWTSEATMLADDRRSPGRAVRPRGQPQEASVNPPAMARSAMASAAAAMPAAKQLEAYGQRQQDPGAPNAIRSADQCDQQEARTRAGRTVHCRLKPYQRHEAAYAARRLDGPQNEHVQDEQPMAEPTRAAGPERVRREGYWSCTGRAPGGSRHRAADAVGVPPES